MMMTDLVRHTDGIVTRTMPSVRVQRTTSPLLLRRSRLKPLDTL